MLMVSERFSLIGHRLGHQCSSWIERRKGLFTHNALCHVLWGQKAGMVGMLLLVLLAPNLVLLFHSSTSANKVANQFLQSEPSSNSPLTHLQTWQHGAVETGKGNFSLGVWLALPTSLWCNFWPNPTPINQIFRLNNFLEHNITSWISW